jgi:hypothetical protein
MKIKQLKKRKVMKEKAIPPSKQKRQGFSLPKIFGYLAVSSSLVTCFSIFMIHNDNPCSTNKHKCILKSISLGLNSVDPSFRHRYMTFVATEGFTNQRIAIQHAAAFAYLANCVLVLPALQSRGEEATVSDPFQQTPTGKIVAFDEIYDAKYFIASMRRAGLAVVQELPKDKVLAWKHLNLGRDHSLEENMGILHKYDTLDYVVLDIGPTFLRFIPTNCQHVDFLWAVEDSLRLSTQLEKLVFTVKDRLKLSSQNYICLHLRNEADAQMVWNPVETGENNKFPWINMPPNMTYVASGSFVPSSLGVSKLQVLQQHELRLSASLDLNQLFDVQAALDFQICADALGYAGPEFSAFSRLLLSKMERAHKPNVMTHTSVPKLEILGTVAPPPRCVPHLLIQQSQFRQQVVRPNQLLVHEQYGDVNFSKCKLAAIILSRISGYTMTGDFAVARGNIDYLEQQ